tara:strand:+ start:351 stop:467 length:117 start_codon:yes stop_codon:yes gene_type:complete
MANDDAYSKKTLPKGHPKRGEWQLKAKKLPSERKGYNV